MFMLQVMENNDCTRLSSESLSGDEVDMQGKDLFHSLVFQSQLNEFSLKSHDPDKDKEITEDLKLGAQFSSHDSAYIAYVKYGGTHGFNVRKQHRKTNKVGFVTRVTYCCSKEGH